MTQADLEVLHVLDRDGHDFTPPIGLGAAAEAAKVFSLPLRREMLVALQGSDMSASQLGQLLERDPRRVSREMKILSEAGYIEQAAVLPPRRGSTPMRIYRLTENCAAIMAAFSSHSPMVALAETIERRDITSQIQRRRGGARRKQAGPAHTDADPVKLFPSRERALRCSCSAPIANNEGACINCSKLVTAAATRPSSRTQVNL